jgi:hypothetical protein
MLLSLNDLPIQISYPVTSDDFIFMLAVNEGQINKICYYHETVFQARKSGGCTISFI